MNRADSFLPALAIILAVVAVAAFAIALILAVSGVEDDGGETPTLEERVKRLERALGVFDAQQVPNRVTEPGGFAKWMVNKAVARYESNGRETTLAYYNNPESMDGTWYVFVLEDRDGALYTVAHPSRPELVGTTRERIDANGYDYGAAFSAVTDDGGGEWISYLFTHPTTRQDELKHTWAERRDNLIFGCGWYRGAE